jgi:hypothetical protein
MAIAAIIVENPVENRAIAKENRIAAVENPVESGDNFL